MTVPDAIDVERGVAEVSGEIAESTVLTVDEVAELLRLERKTVYAAIQRGEIPGARRIGRVIRLSRSAVLEWLRTGQGRVSRSRRIR